MHYCSSSPVSLFAKETVLETTYHTTMYMGHTIMRSEPWVGWGRKEEDVLLGVVPPPLNMAVHPLHGETWMSLPAIYFQKGPLPNVEFLPMPSALEKGAEVCGAPKT